MRIRSDTFTGAPFSSTTRATSTSSSSFFDHLKRCAVLIYLQLTAQSRRPIQPGPHKPDRPQFLLPTPSPSSPLACTQSPAMVKITSQNLIIFSPLFAKNGFECRPHSPKTRLRTCRLWADTRSRRKWPRRTHRGAARLLSAPNTARHRPRPKGRTPRSPAHINFCIFDVNMADAIPNLIVRIGKRAHPYNTLHWENPTAT